MKKMILTFTIVAVVLAAGTAFGADMIAGNPKNGANVVGQVNVSIVGSDLVVQYLITEPDWIITQTHLEIATDPEDFPQSKGNAVPGLFTYITSHEVADGETEVTHTIPLVDIFPGGVVPDVFFVAAHAKVGTLCPCDEYDLNLPSEVTVTAWFAGDEGIDDDSYFDALISGGTDLDGLYDAWCIDTDRSIRPPTFSVRGIPMQAMVYSSYDCTSMPVLEAPDNPLVEYCENMDLVNWILNNIAVGDPSGCDGAYTYGDIQRAIWELVDDDLSTSGLGDWSQCRVDEIIAAATANGEGYEPVCGELVGVIILPYVYMFEGAVLVEPDTAGPGYPGIPRYTDLPEGADIVYVQPIIIMVPVPCCFCGATAWAGTPVTPSGDWPDEDNDGYKYEFPGKDWSMYFSYPEDAFVAEPSAVKGKK